MTDGSFTLRRRWPRGGRDSPEIGHLDGGGDRAWPRAQAGTSGRRHRNVTRLRRVPARRRTTWRAAASSNTARSARQTEDSGRGSRSSPSTVGSRPRMAPAAPRRNPTFRKRTLTTQTPRLRYRDWLPRPRMSSRNLSRRVLRSPPRRRDTRRVSLRPSIRLSSRPIAPPNSRPSSPVSTLASSPVSRRPGTSRRVRRAITVSIRGSRRAHPKVSPSARVLRSVSRRVHRQVRRQGSGHRNRRPGPPLRQLPA